MIHNKESSMLNLVPAIHEIEEQIAQIKASYAKELKPYVDSLDKLRAINTACEKCGGAGKVMRPRACAEDDRERDMITCSVCGGTGLSQIKKDEN
jgi:RecJ-like exonuclease